MMKEYRSLIVIVSFLCAAAACAQTDKESVPAPSLMPHIEKAMNAADFWIRLHPAPDREVLSPDGIIAFNARTETELKLIRDVASGPHPGPGELASRLYKDLQEVRSEERYDARSRPVKEDFYRRMESEVGPEVLGVNIAVKYGFICRRADVRVLPTDEALTRGPQEPDFDLVQNDSFDIATPLAVLGEAADGRWVYVDGPASSGWVKKACIVFCTLNELKGYLAKRPFVVVTASGADLFVDANGTILYGRVRMGSRFPLAEDSADAVKVLVPSLYEDDRYYERVVYIKKEDVHTGFLPYTPRSILEEAFKLLGAPYRWGSSRGGQDCSGFVQEVFATVGIVLPRDSSEQRRVGDLIGEFREGGDDAEKLAVFARGAAGGTTLAWLKGHILLFLGMYQGRPYVIHATYGYKERQALKEVTKTVKRVVVSDLSLGEGSKKGSLLDRVLSIREIELEK